MTQSMVTVLEGRQGAYLQKLEGTAWLSTHAEPELNFWVDMAAFHWAMFAISTWNDLAAIHWRYCTGCILLGNPAPARLQQGDIGCACERAKRHIVFVW
jgi:hypothetical protein